MREFITKSPLQTLRLAKRFSKILSRVDIVKFSGCLGSGKTTFIKGIAQVWGVSQEEVISSSFIILREYRGRIPIFHVDLYRLKKSQIPDEVYEIISRREGLVLIEWAEKIDISGNFFEVKIYLKELNKRKITIRASNPYLEGKLNFAL